jgi:prevent-host-death family protein
MAKIPKIVPITDLRHDAAAVLKRLQSSRQPLVITQRGRAAAVLVSVQDFDRSQHEKELLLLLAKGEQEISKGKGYSLEEVFKEADALLSGERS